MVSTLHFCDVYDILIVDMVVYDMQVWCGCILFEVPLKFTCDIRKRVCITMYGHGFCMYAMVCMNMDSFLLLK